MNPVLEEVYSTVMPAAPFVVGAYVFIWVILAVFIVIMFLNARKTRQDIDALRDALERRERDLEACKESDD